MKLKSISNSFEEGKRSGGDIRWRTQRQLRREKVRIINTKVTDCRTDTRKLYSLVNGLIGLTAQNPLPENQIKMNWWKNLDQSLCPKSVKFGMN